MVKEPDSPFTIPSRLPVWDFGERILFPFNFQPIRLPLSTAKPLLDEVRNCGDLLALGPIPRGLRKAATGVGVVTQILRVAAASGEVTVLVQGVARAKLSLTRRRGTVRWGSVEVMGDHPVNSQRLTGQALLRGIQDRLEQIAGASRGVSGELLELLDSIEDPARYSDLLAGALSLPIPRARLLLEQQNPIERLSLLKGFLSEELEILTIQDRLDRHTRDEMDKRQKDYYLRQQLEAIRLELGEEDGTGGSTGYRDRLKALDMPSEVKACLAKEVERLGRFGPYSEELSQARSYLDLALELPWGEITEDQLDLKRAERDLNRDHYGLRKVKRRILEHLAVTKLKGGQKGTLFCFVGPPGVGKTSLGRAIARTLGRKFVRMSLGGVRDESEIRGHRKTYIGAMPGRIIQGIKNAGSMNPVFILDEVDKMGADWRGDPSSALLEALDPEQNREFVDHYLGFPFDLSRVMFVATANTLESVHPAFLDRMEVLELPGYTEEEKIAIARRHILPREIEAHGLKEASPEIGEEALRSVIRRFTREAGVRNLERCIQSILRRVARKVAGGEEPPFEVRPKNLGRMVDRPAFLKEDRLRVDRIGVATGLAWTEVGGELLYVEATATQGSGSLTLTGQLGEVMRESVQAALTYLKEHREGWKLTPKTFTQKDIHVHVPEGAIPKDGPSAGVTMAVAMLSTLTGRPVSHTTAFSGEITLRGEILPVGGLREKLLAAQRARIRKVVLPAANRSERAELPRAVLRDIELVWVRTMDEVFPHALGKETGRRRNEESA